MEGNKKAAVLALVAVLMIQILSTSPSVAGGEDILVGYWKMDEGSGQVAGDSSGMGNNALLRNSPSWTDGWIGKAVRFDGINDYLRVLNSESLSIRGDKMTVEMWILPTVTLDSSSPAAYMLEKGNEYGLAFNRFGNGEISFKVILGLGEPQEATVSTLTGTWEAGRWYHIAGVYDGGSMRLYVNGVLEGVELASGELHAQGTYMLTIGSSYLGSSMFFKGAIDEARVYSSAKSAEDIAYDASTLVGYWRLDEGAGSIARDYTRISRDGAIVGCQWVPGKFGSALKFNGAGDYVRIPTSVSIERSSITLMAWVKFDGFPSPSAYKGNPDSTILAKGNNDTIPGFLALEQTGRDPEVFQFYINEGGEVYRATGTTDIIEGIWYHVAGTYDGHALRLYVNGYLEAETEVDLERSLNGLDLFVGSMRMPTFENYINGTIDEVKIFSVALDRSAIVQEMKAPPLVPSAPLNLRANGGATSIYLEWEAPAEIGSYAIESYRVYRGIAPGTGEAIATVGSSVHSYLDEAATANDLYYYYVTATNFVGEGEASNIVKCSTLEAFSGIAFEVALDGFRVMGDSWFSCRGGFAVPIEFSGGGAGGEASEYLWAQIAVDICPRIAMMRETIELSRMEYIDGAWQSSIIASADSGYKPLSNKFSVKATIDGDLLVIKTNLMQLDLVFNLTPITSHRYMFVGDAADGMRLSPEVGFARSLAMGTAVNFEPQTSGNVSVYARAGSSAWITANLTGVATPANSRVLGGVEGLSWIVSDGSFSTSLGSSEAGFTIGFDPPHSSLGGPVVIPAPAEGVDAVTADAIGPIHLLVRDSQGRATGYNVSNGELVFSASEIEYITSPRRAIIFDPSQAYELSIIGMADGNYTIRLFWETAYGAKEIFFEEEGNIVWGKVSSHRIYLPEAGSPMVDDEAPFTVLRIYDAQNSTINPLSVKNDTYFELISDDASGSGAATTKYRITNSSYDSGWVNYSAPFRLDALAPGEYILQYFSIDKAGNSEGTRSIAVRLVGQEGGIFGGSFLVLLGIIIFAIIMTLIVLLAMRRRA